MPVEQARHLVDAEFRPPIRRGDLDQVEPGRLVAMIDGVFEQTLAISPREVHQAVGRGVRLMGGSSMGALRAAEVPGMMGIGRVYDWYRDGVISRDDEVSLLFDERDGRAVTVPMVNVRFSVERLCRPGTLDRELGDRIIEAALSLPYERRRYRTILRVAGLLDRPDADDLLGMLEAYDVKQQDAQAVLEALDREIGRTPSGPVRPCEPDGGSTAEASSVPGSADARVDPVLVWESGDRVDYGELLTLLAMTGRLDEHARRAVTRFALEGNDVETTEDDEPPRGESAQAIFMGSTQRWGWMSTEETRVTLADLGIALDEVAERCGEEQIARAVVRAVIRDDTPEFRAALRVELFMNDMALKRETMRLGSLHVLADQGGDTPPTASETQTVRTVLCKLNQVFGHDALQRQWDELGLRREETDAMVNLIARARRAGRRIVGAMRGVDTVEPARAAWPEEFALGPCPKPSGEARFSWPMARARAAADSVREAIGITRVGMIGELGDLGGIQIAQAARPQNRWSSTYGSGKSRTEAGAIVGSVMEETEKWAQEEFAPSSEQLLHGSFESLRDEHPVVDPATLDLPYDTAYTPTLEMQWCRGIDLLSRRETYLPLDLFRIERGKHDICYTLRGARKAMATNGLGSGFTREEAVLHAVCEFVERHAARMAELYIANPGGLGVEPFHFVDLDGCSTTITTLVEDLRRHGAVVQAQDITSEIGIPTFVASVIRDFRRAEGQGTHPNPEVALEMALLEAGQTIATNAAGGREDLAIKVRSLGRHERPRPVALADAWRWLDPDLVQRPLAASGGIVDIDVHEELRWCIERLRLGGVRHAVAVDLSSPQIAPAHVVRVVIAGLESNNPFFTGPRARLALLRDLLPRWV